jgi:hypothetical protein
LRSPPTTPKPTRPPASSIPSSQALSEAHRAEILELRRSIAAEVRGLISRGLLDGGFDTPNPRMAATAALSLGIDVARWHREEREWTPDDVGAYYADLALRIVGARP